MIVNLIRLSFDCWSDKISNFSNYDCFMTYEFSDTLETNQENNLITDNDDKNSCSPDLTLKSIGSLNIRLQSAISWIPLLMFC